MEKYLITDKGIYEKLDNRISINNKLNQWCETNNNLKKTNLKLYNEKKNLANIVSSITQLKAREYIKPIDKNLIYSFGDFGLSLNIKVKDQLIFETSSIVDDFESGTYEENKKIIEEYISNLENNYVNLLMYLHETTNTKALEKIQFKMPANFDVFNQVPNKRLQRAPQYGGDKVSI